MKSLFKPFMFILILFVLLSGGLIGYSLVNQNNKSIDFDATGALTNPTDEYEGRTAEQIEGYKQYLKDVQAYRTRIVETGNTIKDEINNINNDSVFNDVGAVLSTIGTSFSYEYYDTLDWSKFALACDEYITRQDEYTLPEFEDEETKFIFDETQLYLDSIDLNSDNLYLDVHNALQYAAAYNYNAKALNWSNWLLAAKKCDYFNPNKSLVNNAEETNTLFGDIFNLKVVSAYDQSMGTTINSSVTLGSNQTTWANVSGATDNRNIIRYTGGSTQTVLINQTGLYKIYGLGGGGGKDGPTDARGGSGGTATTYAFLTKDTVLYVNIGGYGLRTAEGGREKNRDPGWAPAQVQGGYNGGGWGITRDSWNSSDTQGQGGSGGGATSVCLQDGLLKDVSQANVLLVAGGGGGGSGIETGNNEYAGHGGGGGLDGNRSNGTGSPNAGNSPQLAYGHSGSKGTQTTGGTARSESQTGGNGSYGQGGDSNRHLGGGGGGGYYGGAGASWNGQLNGYGIYAGGGGSSYIANSSITFGEVTYTGSVENGSNGSTPAGDNASQTGGGSVTITLVALPQIAYTGTSDSVIYNPTTAQSVSGNTPTNGSGTFTYEVTSQKQGTTNVSYFSMNGKDVVVAAGTPVGTYSLTVKATDSNYASSASAPWSITVEKAANPIVFNNQTKNMDYSPNATNVALTAATGTQGDVTYTIDSQKQGATAVSYFTMNGSNVVVAAGTPVGTYTIDITVTASGNSNYSPGSKSATLTLVINKAENPMSVVTPQNKTMDYSVDDNTLAFTPVANAQGTVTYSLISAKTTSGTDISNVSIPDGNISELLVKKDLPVGTYVIKVKAHVAGNFNYKEKDLEITINLTVVHASIPSIDVTYYAMENNKRSTSISGSYNMDNRNNAQNLEMPYEIDVDVRDLPLASGKANCGITKVFYQLSTNNGKTFSDKIYLYNDAATTSDLHYEITSPKISGTYYIKIGAENKSGNVANLADIYRVVDGPSLLIKSKVYYLNSTVTLADLLSVASARDDIDGDISSQIIVEKIEYEDGTVVNSPDSLDTTKVQQASITYSITNSQGKYVSKVSNVQIVAQRSASEEGDLQIYDRYIDEDYLDSLRDDSIWNTDEGYKNALEDAVKQEGTPINAD